MNYRYVTSAFVGVVLFFLFFQPFLPYSRRSQFSLGWWPFPVVALLCGFLLSLGLKRRRFWVPTCLMLTLFAANAILIVIDFVSGAYVVLYRYYGNEVVILAIRHGREAGY